jgi:hypothetical protein
MNSCSIPGPLSPWRTGANAATPTAWRSWKGGASLKRVSILMEKYRNVPMDYADATLVALGEELGTDLVFTLDRRGFSAYRLHQRRTFRLVPH